MATFPCMKEFAKHFENQPLLAGESGNAATDARFEVSHKHMYMAV